MGIVWAVVVAGFTVHNVALIEEVRGVIRAVVVCMEASEDYSDGRTRGRRFGE